MKNTMSNNKEMDREQIVQQFLPRIKYYANKYSFGLPPELSTEDLISAGIVGLLEAVERFDSTKNTSISTFADFRIRGAMIDEIRSMQWASKDARKRLEDVRNTYSAIEKENKRPATDEEVAKKLNMSYEDLYKTLSVANKMNLLSLDDFGIDSNGNKFDILEMIPDKQAVDIIEQLNLKEIKQALGRFIDELPETERMIISLYYYDELTLKEIGKVLKLSESRICQLHGKSILILKNKLEDFLNK
ncbi:MAG TPA: FliA/WhiG family RNA polymerase sigma factor [Nitrospirae bacterium]|nr:FliA/WhiG family RNA polymerase sigma factor [Nitrospirota bacterium]